MAAFALPLMAVAAVTTIAGSVMAGRAQKGAAQVQGALAEQQGIDQEQGAIAQQTAALYSARLMEEQAGQERALAQRAVSAQRKQKDLAISRAVALAAASGGGVADPSVLDTIGDLETEGELRAYGAWFEGEDRARNLEARAAGATYESQAARYAGFRARKAGEATNKAYRQAGSAAQTGTIIGGVSSALGSVGGSLFAKYG